MEALRLAALAVLLFATGCSSSEIRSEGHAPNIVLVITDDQGYGDLGCHGNPQIRTPNIDAFAKQSVELERFHVCPVCSPTRSSLLTGRYNYRTGIVDTSTGRSLMYPDEVTLAEMLGGAGYRTGIFGKWHLGDNYPMRAIDQGFQEALTIKGGGLGQPSDPPGGDHYQDPTLYRNGTAVKTKGYVTDVLTDAAIEFITANRDRPFFTYVAFNAPHTPLEVPAGYLEPYAAAGLPDITARIYAMETNIDDNVGRLLARLDELRLARDTIFIFMTDNGPQQARYNANLRGLKGTVFDGGIRVPFFIRWPGRFEAGRKIDRIAAHIDIVPTLLEACGVSKPAVKLDGVSLLPLLTGRAKEWPDRTLFFQWHRGDEPQLGRACAARTQRWKMVRLVPEQKPMLFDLSNDSEEKTDVATANPGVVDNLALQYEDWFRDVGATRGYAPSRIHIGTIHEDPVVLTRQDMRGPKAGWAKEAVGYWEVDVEREIQLRIVLRFRPPESEAILHYKVQRIGEPATTYQSLVQAGSRECVIPLVLHGPGPARIEPFVRYESGAVFGVDYVELKRVE